VDERREKLYFVPRMTEDARQKPEDFLSELGHELGNYLAPIRNALTLMEHQSVDARTVEYARSVIRQQLAELEKLSQRLTGGAPESAPSRSEGKGRRILIADDNRAWVDSLASVLRNEGYTVFAAYGGREAVAMAAEVQPDCVLLDIEMPEMSGYETARRLRQQLPDHPMQIIAITVWGRESDRAAARLAGFNHHLTKPLLFDQLVQVLPH
jgi:CheY-like chemotaxis protein